jgi:predicted acetyltransferase
MKSAIRHATSSDKEQILNVTSYAYSIPETSHERFLERLDSSAEEFLIHFLDDKATAVGRLIPFEQNIRGIMKKMGGIGMVASIPEFRRQGFVRDLMIHALEEMRKDGYGVSTLYPFKDTFYSALGYVKMPPFYIFEASPDQLRRFKNPDEYTVTRESGEEAINNWRTIQEHVIKRTHGAVLRSDKRWTELTNNMKSKIVIARNSNGIPEGVIIYSIKGYGEGHSWAETGEISISEFYWKSLDSRDALLYHLYKHEDQIVNMKMVLGTPMQDFYHWITEFHTPKIKSHIVNMARVVDIDTSFSGLSVPINGEINLRIEDTILPENAGSYRFKSKENTLVVDRIDEEPKLTLSIEGATCLLYGTLDIDHLKHYGWLRGETPDLLPAWFSRATPWITEDF